MKNKAVFVDKDGTLVRDIPYNVNPTRISLLPYAGEGLRLLQNAGYKIVVVSNQSGVARGFFKEADLAAVEKKLTSLLFAHGVKLSGLYYCPHLPFGVAKDYAIDCDCRKPEPGLLYKAASEQSIELTNSFMIGDILNDIEAGRNAGCQTILIDNGGETEWLVTEERVPHAVVTNMLEAAAYILQQKTTVSTL